MDFGTDGMYHLERQCIRAGRVSRVLETQVASHLSFFFLQHIFDIYVCQNFEPAATQLSRESFDVSSEENDLR